jgi:hypothetical protein
MHKLRNATGINVPYRWKDLFRRTKGPFQEPLQIEKNSKYKLVVLHKLCHAAVT